MGDADKRLGVVIVAAGRSQRMGGLDKQFALMGGRPVLAHALDVFARHPAVWRLAVVTSPASLASVRRLAVVVGPKPVTVVIGGARRQDSVRRGVVALADCGLLAIHDGARPLVTGELIERGLAALADKVAAIAVVPVTDTIKRVDSAGLVVDTPARAQLRAAQTPQFFRRAALEAVYAAADWEREYTDEAGLLEAHGQSVGTFAGATDNIKVTTPADLAIAEALWRLRQGEGV